MLLGIHQQHGHSGSSPMVRSVLRLLLFSLTAITTKQIQLKLYPQSHTLFNTQTVPIS